MESITKQLVNIGHGMSKEIAADEPAVAKLLVELSSALDVQYERGNALEAKCAALAAENAALKAFGDKLNDMHNDLNGEGTGIQGRAEVACQQVALEAAIDEFSAIETPATSAFLAEVRASGIDQWIASRDGRWNGTTKEAERFAAKLRLGGAV